MIKVTATDEDDGDNGRVRYEIDSGNLEGAFWIDNHTGEILVDGPIDREITNSYTLIIRATDLGFPISREVFFGGGYFSFKLLKLSHCQKEIINITS